MRICLFCGQRADSEEHPRVEHASRVDLSVAPGVFSERARGNPLVNRIELPLRCQPPQNKSPASRLISFLASGCVWRADSAHALHKPAGESTFYCLRGTFLSSWLNEAATRSP